MKNSEYTVELLVEAGLITQTKIDKAWAAVAASGGKLDIIQASVKLGYVKQDKITEILAQQYGLETIDLKEYQIPKDVIAKVNGELAREYGIIPVMYHGSTLTVAISDPSDIETLDALRFRLKCDIEAVVTTKAEIDRVINLHYCSPGVEQLVDKFLKPKAGDAKPTLVKLMICPDKTSLASKSHPYRKGCCDIGTRCVPYEPDEEPTKVEPDTPEDAEPMVKIKWRRLEDYEVLRVGDMWASEDPNTPERQSEMDYNLQMQAAGVGEHPVSGTGAHWRPVGVVLDSQAPQLLICKAVPGGFHGKPHVKREGCDKRPVCEPYVPATEKAVCCDNKEGMAYGLLSQEQRLEIYEAHKKKQVEAYNGQAWELHTGTPLFNMGVYRVKPGCRPGLPQPTSMRLPKLLNVLKYKTAELQTLCLAVNDLTRWLEAQKTEAKLEKSKS